MSSVSGSLRTQLAPSAGARRPNDEWRDLVQTYSRERKDTPSSQGGPLAVETRVNRDRRADTFNPVTGTFGNKNLQSALENREYSKLERDTRRSDNSTRIGVKYDVINGRFRGGMQPDSSRVRKEVTQSGDNYDIISIQESLDSPVKNHGRVSKRISDSFAARDGFDVLANSPASLASSRYQSYEDPNRGRRKLESPVEPGDFNILSNRNRQTHEVEGRPNHDVARDEFDPIASKFNDMDRDMQEISLERKKFESTVRRKKENAPAWENRKFNTVSWEVQDSQGADPEGTLDAINQYKRNLRKFDDDSYRDTQAEIQHKKSVKSLNKHVSGRIFDYTRTPYNAITGESDHPIDVVKKMGSTYVDENAASIAIQSLPGRGGSYAGSYANSYAEGGNLSRGYSYAGESFKELEGIAEKERVTPQRFGRRASVASCGYSAIHARTPVRRAMSVGAVSVGSAGSRAAGYTESTYGNTLLQSYSPISAPSSRQSRRLNNADYANLRASKTSLNSPVSRRSNREPTSPTYSRPSGSRRSDRQRGQSLPASRASSVQIGPDGFQAA